MNIMKLRLQTVEYLIEKTILMLLRIRIYIEKHNHVILLKSIVYIRKHTAFGRKISPRQVVWLDGSHI